MSANIYRRGNIWWARVQVRGRDHRRSLRTNVKKVAKERLATFLSETDHFLFYGEERHTWQDAVVEWGKAAPSNLRPATLQRYLVSLTQLRPYLDDLYLDQIDKKLVSKIASRSGVSNATRRRDMTAASQVLRLAEANDWIEANPIRLWDRSVIPERRDPIQLPQADDISALVDAAPDTFGALIRVLQYTGMRMNECASLESAQIDWQRNAINLPNSKTNRPRSVPMDDRTVGTITGTPRSMRTGFVFWHGDGQRYHRCSNTFIALRRRVNKNRANSGVPNIRFRLHDLRHWHAVDYLREGGSIYDLQQNLGHSSLTTTEIYLAFLRPDEKQTSKRMGTIPGTGTTV